jgi:undecaprenyl-diphosphatase
MKNTPIESEPPSRYARLLDRLGPFEILLYVPVMLAVAGTWFFMWMASEVLDGDTQKFDGRLIRMMRQPSDLSVPIGPPWLHEAGRDLTALGGPAVMVIMITIVAGYLWLHRKYRAMWFALFATCGGLAVSLVLKSFFSRDRPTEVPHLSETMTSSFPSGHSMLSAVVYLTLGMLLTRVVNDRASKIYFLLVAMTLTFLVGMSRVYLGVHYPTDVLAGWTAGLVWALFCWMVMRYLQSRGEVEGASEMND